MWVSFDRLIKCALVERLNRTLRTRMLKKFTATQNENWLDTLPALVDNYNRSVNTSHGLAPARVADTPDHTLRAQMALYPRSTNVKKAATGRRSARATQ